MKKKRQVPPRQRANYKFAFGLLVLGVLVLIVAVVVEKRSRGNIAEVQVQVTDVSTDFNGDPVTDPFASLNAAQTPHAAKPPVRQRHFEDRDQFIEAQRQKKLLEEAVKLELPSSSGPKRDWHDYAAMETDAHRVGLGEQGVEAFITDESLQELEQELSMDNGFNALLSDKISVNRSLPDVRNEACLDKEYLVELPSTSVILIYFNEYFSVLVRSMHSIVNRTPAELLKEIVLVDDCSDREYLRDQLDAYIAEHFPGLVKVVRLKERTGLIGARLAGARAATADVLVFFDSHIECSYNWLPPLLEPIAINPNVSTCPIVDVIDHANFEYRSNYREGARGVFNWQMLYKQLPLLPEQTKEISQPYHSPVMMGGLFAIGREFFWQLGGYDEGLDIWGAEQYELSFKIWMCGGMLLDVPCSHVGHIFRGPMTARKNPRNYNFVAKNHMRVAEVWMDEYKEYVYERNPASYKNLDPGDLTAQKAIRERLQCKSFKWFLEVVAPDLLIKYPPVEPPVYASGAIQNKAYPIYCLDTMGRNSNQPVGLFSCADNKTHPQSSQFWVLSQYRDIRLEMVEHCLDISDHRQNATVLMWSCHGNGGNQFWYYDREHQWIVHGRPGKLCLEAIPIANDKMEVYANVCDNSNDRMKWIFGHVNDTALDSFFDGLDVA